MNLSVTDLDEYLQIGCLVVLIHLTGVPVHVFNDQIVQYFGTLAAQYTNSLIRLS